MRNKQELIFTHQLLNQVKQHISERSNVDTPQYDSLNVNPNELHATTESHKNAVMKLSEELSSPKNLVES